MVAVCKAQRWAALVMLLVLLLATTGGLASPVAVSAEDPPSKANRNTLEQGDDVTAGTEPLTTPSTRAPESVTTCASPAVAIPDNNPVGVTSEIEVLNGAFIGDLNIYVSITHTWVGDLRVTIEHVETGTSVTIIDQPGVPALGPFGCSEDSIVAGLDDEGPTPVEDECAVAVPAIQGTFIPNNPLYAFDGENLKGTWRLTVSDHAGGDLGTLNEWCLINTSHAGYVVDAGGTDHLWMIDLDSGLPTDMGPVGYGNVEALAFAPNGTLYGIDAVREELITIDLVTGAGSQVGYLGVEIDGPGLAFDVLGNLWMVDNSTQNLYSVDPRSGHATIIGTLGQQVTGLAARGMQLFGLGGDGTNNLVTINTATGAATPVGSLGTVTVQNGGLGFDAEGSLWGITDTIPATVFNIDTGSGAATVQGTITLGLAGIESLAIPPAPVAYAVDSDDADHLWLLYLNLGIVFDVGSTNYDNIEALTFAPDGTLYGVDDGSDYLVTLDLTTGGGAYAGSLGVGVEDPGLAFDWAGHLWLVDNGTQNLYSVRRDTGQATLIGPLGQKVTALTAYGPALYGLGGDGANNLVTIDTATGAATPVGPLVNVTVQDGGLAFDSYGNLWGISNNNPDPIFVVNPSTGKATDIATVVGAHGYDNLALLVPLQRIYLPLVLRAY